MRVVGDVEQRQAIETRRGRGTPASVLVSSARLTRTGWSAMRSHTLPTRTAASGPRRPAPPSRPRPGQWYDRPVERASLSVIDAANQPPGGARCRLHRAGDRPGVVGRAYDEHAAAAFSRSPSQAMAKRSPADPKLDATAQARNQAVRPRGLGVVDRDSVTQQIAETNTIATKVAVAERVATALSLPCPRPVGRSARRAATATSPPAAQGPRTAPGAPSPRAGKSGRSARLSKMICTASATTRRRASPGCR